MDAQPSSHKATALSADDLLPLLSFVVVCAYQQPAQPLRHMRAQIEYIDALLPAHLKLGQTGGWQFSMATILHTTLALTVHCNVITRKLVVCGI
jgi:hypothetical protein